MFRIVGIGMIVCGSAVWVFAVPGMRRKRKTLETIRQFVMLLHGGDGDGLRFAPEAFLHISKRLGGSFGVFFGEDFPELEKVHR